MPESVPEFVQQPYMSARVLDESDCPPPGIWHEISDYPLYYDVTYFPEYHSHLFVSSGSLSDWLTSYLLSTVRAVFLPSSTLSFVYGREGYTVTIMASWKACSPFERFWTLLLIAILSGNSSLSLLGTRLRWLTGKRTATPSTGAK